MSIQDDFNKINPKTHGNGPKSNIPVIETVSFNEKGEIISNSTFSKVFLPILVVLISTLSFGLGRLSKINSISNIEIGLDATYSTTTATYNSVPKVEASKQNSSPQTTTVSSNEVVASVKGTKYHYLYCPGAKQISEANKITFQNAAAAEAAGYTLALNCKPR